MNANIIKNEIILPVISRVGSTHYNWDLLKNIFRQSVRKLDAQGYLTGQEAAFISLLTPELPTFRAVSNETFWRFVYFTYCIEIDHLNLSSESRLQLELYLKNSGSVVERATDSLFLISGNLSQFKTMVVYLCCPASRNVSLDFILRYIGNWLVYDFTKLKLEDIFHDYTRIPYIDGTFFLRSNCNDRCM